MSAKFKNTRVMYSTNPDFNDWDDEVEEVVTPNVKAQKLYVSLDKKQRRGKKVTLVTGFIGKTEDLKDLGSLLKSKCGVGGSVKDEQIIIQGDFKAKIFEMLTNMGYSCKTKG